jgi:hypothetical protein
MRYGYVQKLKIEILAALKTYEMFMMIVVQVKEVIHTLGRSKGGVNEYRTAPEQSPVQAVYPRSLPANGEHLTPASSFLPVLTR